MSTSFFPTIFHHLKEEMQNTEHIYLLWVLQNYHYLIGILSIFSNSCNPNQCYYLCYFQRFSSQVENYVRINDWGRKNHFGGSNKFRIRSRGWGGHKRPLTYSTKKEGPKIGKPNKFAFRTACLANVGSLVNYLG